MPVLSRFYGIIIRMYFLQKEHNPPHIHAIYNDDVAAVEDIYLPRRLQWCRNGLDCIKTN